MSDANGNPVPPLEEIAEREGDADLFPDEVRRLHEQGQGRRARKALLARAKVEPRAERAAKQKAYAEDLRLWAEPVASAPRMYTLNGIGTSLYGKHQAEDDGLHIGTLWFVLLFIPIWPFASYLVAPGEESGSFYFLARSPLAPAARRMRKLVAGLVVLSIGAVAWNLTWSSRHADVHVYNGFEQPLVASVAGVERIVAPRQAQVLRGVQTGPVEFAARLVDGSAELERFTHDLGGHGGETIVYNIGGRAVLARRYVRYGKGTPPEEQLLPGDPVQALGRIDYPFITPPDTKEVREGGSIQNTVLEAIDGDADVVDVTLYLADIDRESQALGVARAELQLHPDNARLASVAASYLLAGDPPAGLELARDCRDRAPEVVELHRLFQDLVPEDQSQQLVEDYEARLAAQPDSAMHHYLMGRISKDGDAAVAHYRRALELDSEFDYPHLALGYQMALAGRWREAARQYERFAAFSAEHAEGVRDERVRLARLQGRTPAQVARLAEGPDLLSAHVRLANRPRDLERELEKWQQETAGAEGEEEGTSEELFHHGRADLAITAGRLDVARESLAALEALGELGFQPALRLALSVGSAADDRARLQRFLEPERMTPAADHLQLLSLLVAQREGWEQRDWLRELVATTDLAAVGDYVAEPGPEALASARASLSGLGLPTRWAAQLALSRALEGRSPAEASALRRDATRMALPSELPYLGR
jgi:hypothetical protein